MDIATAFRTARQHHDRRQWQQAEALYRKILAASPGHPGTLNMLGRLRLETGHHADAARLLAAAAKATPGSASIHISLGAALRQLGRMAEALQQYDRALACDPESAVALNNRGELLLAAGRHAQALKSLDRAVALRPDIATAWNNRGRALVPLYRYKDAIASYGEAIRRAPRFAWAYLCRGEAHWLDGNCTAAINDFRMVASLEPANVMARWAATMALVPIVPMTREEVPASRKAFAEGLDRLATFLEDSRRTGFTAVGAIQPFYLAYQETANLPLLRHYGDLCVRQMRNWQSVLDRSPLPAKPGTRCRLGIVTAFLFEHSVWSAIVQGWIDHLDRERVELHVFCLNSTTDAETDRARARADSFHSGRTDLRGWVERIRNAGLDVLIYPEIGMDTVSLRLACLRLAPVQATTWGHPETSGLPTMDYYISAADFEPEGAAGCYSEKLVTLPHLGCCVPASDTVAEAPDLAALGIDPERPVLICPGTPFKYAPHLDRVLLTIAQRLPGAQLVFFRAQRYHGMAERLHARLAQAFAGTGLDYAASVRELSFLSRARFLGLLSSATLFLDTIGFSGFNTALAAVEAGLPIVTREGRFLRGRLASGILRRMGMGDTVVADEAAYVEKVVELVTDAPARTRTRERMLAGRERVFGDVAPVRALEQHLVAWSRERRGPGHS